MGTITRNEDSAESGGTDPSEGPGGTDSPPKHPFARFDRLWKRHGRTFWILHSIWALATGVVVIRLSHEQYGFFAWVLGFLVVTWGSTLFFSRPPSSAADGTYRARYGRGFASYMTRIMYQETLFFLLPFYAYSVVLPSWNVTFVILLGVLAVLSCLDLVFDRWLRESPVFGLMFFASVAFGALNLLLPSLLTISPFRGTQIAAVAALGSALPLSIRAASGAGSWLRLGGAAAVLLIVTLGLPQLVPPVPLRLQEATFTAGIDRASLEPLQSLDSVVDRTALADGLIVVARVFSPAAVPAKVVMDWYVEGQAVRSSREVEIVAHEGGYRVWDILRPEQDSFQAGTYRVVLRTVDGRRMFGSASIDIR